MPDNDPSVRLASPTPAEDITQRFTWLFEHMAEGFCIVELIDGPHGPLSDYRYLYANPACTRHTGLRKVVGKTLREIAPGEADAWLHHFASVLDSGAPKQIVQRMQTTGRELKVSFHRLGPASARCMAVLFHERRNDRHKHVGLEKLNEQLGQQVDRAVAERKLFAQLVDSSLANVMVVDMDMRLQAINRTASQSFQQLGLPVPAFGVSLRDLPGTYPQIKEQLLAMWERALAGEVFIENVALQLPPSERHFEMRFNLLRSDAGQLLGAYLFAYDITERVLEHRRLRDTQDALRNAQKMEAVGQLTGGIAHDFNNLLGGISGALELASQRMSQARSVEAVELIEVAQQNAARAAQLVQRLLTFARHQTLQPVPVDIHSLINDMQPLIRTSLGEHINVIDLTQPGQWLACVDPPQLENAVLNLCINARDAMPAGGTLILSSSNISLTAAQGQTLDLPAGQYLQLRVEDNGSGMSADTAARAIDPFFTTKPLGQGTGLGLSMVYGFVRQSGGQLHIQSSPACGTLVDLYLPRNLGNAALPATAVTANQPLTGQPLQRSVLLVEDQHTLRQVVSEVLQDQGYQVSAFDTGVAALQAMRDGLAPHLLISDIGLPGGIDGRTLTLEAVTLYPTLRVLFITGYDPAQALSDFPLTPAMACLAKPFTLNALVDTVRSLLDNCAPP